ncbi:MAG: hypothetical protein JWM10_5361 [Myxococcaceae bacterium]|nr:hypothetical protein [Myxococcaceae bacterium]
MSAEYFELEMLGGRVEGRYRASRPDVERLPWGTLRPESYAPEVVAAGRRMWSQSAFQEYRTAVACSVTLKALLEARAPLDLVAMATRFPLDEVVHVELCARMAMELGGGVPIVHDPDALVAEARADYEPVLRCADLVVRFFCVGEALSIPMLRGTWHAATHPLPRGVLGLIVKDEAAHGSFGFTFLDWAMPLLAPGDELILAAAADATVRSVKRNWDDLRRRPKAHHSEANPLGWMQTDDYLKLAARSLERRVLAPLRARGIPVTETAA